MKFSRLSRLALFALAFAVVLAPEAEAQRGRRGGGGGKRGGGGGARAGGGVFAGKKKKKGGTIGNAPLVRGAATPAPPPGPAPTPSKPSPLAAGEKKFQDLVAQIDKVLAEDDKRRAGLTAETEAPLAVAPPPGVEPGSPQWRELERPIFLAVDADRSGWLSYRELQDAFDCDRMEFTQYDRDHDGRVTSREFMGRYDELVQRTGTFLTPRQRITTQAPAPRTPDQLRVAFDTDADGAIDASELPALLAEHGRTPDELDSVLEAVDSNGDRRVGPDELFQLSRVLSYSLALPTDSKQTPRQSAKSVVELFGKAEPRPSSVSSAAGPPQIAGPVPHFRRLDLDADGFISTEDLRVLQGSMSLGARIATVIASLDADEDGRISEREFAAALATPPRGPARER